MGVEQKMVPVRARVIIEDTKPATPNLHLIIGIDIECERPPRWVLSYFVGRYEDMAPEGSTFEQRGHAIAVGSRIMVDQAIPRLFTNQRTIMIEVFVSLPAGVYRHVLYNAESTKE